MPFIDETDNIVNDNEISFNKTQHYHTEKEMREVFDYISSNVSTPYMMKLGECRDFFSGWRNSYSQEQLLRFVISLIEGIDGNAINMENFMEQTKNDDQNRLYHCCKIMYLIDQYRTVGLHSTMQCISEGNNVFVHPGMSRIHAHTYLNAYDENIIVWDRHNKISNHTPISFDEWYNVFKMLGKRIFATNVEGQILEMHMEEQRTDIVSSVQNTRAMFNFDKPILLGNCEDDVYQYVRTDTTESKGVVIDNLAGDYTFKKEDLIHLLSLYPYSSEKVVKENFVIYVK